MIDRIVIEGKEYAIIIRASYTTNKVEFLTEENYSQQIAFMHHATNKLIDAHIHNHESRNVVNTQEVLVIRRGRLRVDFYTPDTQEYRGSKILEEGDVILLSYGGHGFRVVEEVEMIEVKQGPYLGEKDKERFIGIEEDKVTYI